MSLKKVFAIDDDQDIQKLIKVYLKNKYEVEFASNGEDAFKALQASPKLPDVILLDVEMPVMDGLAFKKLIKAQDRLKNIPIIYLTANTRFRDQVDHESDFDFLNKPIEKDDLLSILETLFLKSHD